MKKSTQVIESIELSSAHIIIVHFKCFWYQEDIELLSSMLFAKLSKIQVVETIQGADRENTRFVWQTKYHFSLNFDCYSQSCWLEGEDERSNEQLTHLIPALPVN